MEFLHPTGSSKPTCYRTEPSRSRPSSADLPHPLARPAPRELVVSEEAEGRSRAETDSDLRGDVVTNVSKPKQKLGGLAPLLRRQPGRHLPVPEGDLAS